MLKEIHKRGHEIGNHTMRHRSLPTLTDEEVYKEVDGVNQAVYKKVGVTPKVLRPPYGSGNYNVHNIIRMAGCEVIYWSHDSLDWDPERTASEIINRATNNIDGGSIVLFHNSAPKTEQTLRKILDKYKELGLEIVPVSELIYHNYFTIDKLGHQKLKKGYAAVKPSELLGDYTPSIPVTGAAAPDQPPVPLALKPAFDDRSQVRTTEDIAKIKENPSLLEIQYDCGDTIAAPVQAGDRIGTATFCYKNEVWFKAEVTAAQDIPVYEPPKEEPVGSADVSPSDAENAGRDNHSLAYVMDAVLILCLAGAALFLYARNRAGKQTSSESDHLDSNGETD